MTNFNRIFANGITIGVNLRALRVLTFAIIASMTLVACSDSDSDEPPENEGLIGIWEVDGDNRDDYYLEISEQLSSNIVQIEFRASTFLVSADCFTYDFTF